MYIFYSLVPHISKNLLFKKNVAHSAYSSAILLGLLFSLTAESGILDKILVCSWIQLSRLESYKIALKIEDKYKVNKQNDSIDDD